MKHYFGLSLSAVIAVVCILGCGDSRHTPNDNIGPNEPVLKLTFISYEMVQKKVLRPYCLSCHSGKNDTYLDTYQDVIDNLAAIRHSVFEAHVDDKKFMPPVRRGPMGANAKNILLTWINMSAPKELVSIPEPGTYGVSGETMDITWTDVKREVFDKACNRCHKPNNDWNAADYTTPKEVRAVMNTMMTMVLFGKAMPPRQDPPKPLPKDWLDNEAMRDDPNPNAITGEQKVLLYKWFLNGMKD